MSQRKGYCGLENQGSSCYLNAVLQTLFMTKGFREHVESLDRDGVSSDGNLAGELNKLFNKLETEQEKAVSATGITKSLGIKNVHEQRGAAELLHLILEKTPESSKLFKGTMKKRRTCRSCRHKPEETLESFLSFQVSLQNSQDVEDALQAYARENKREDLVTCEYCRKMTVVETKSEMVKFPEHMIVELKRSEMMKSSYGSSYSRNDPEVIIRPHITVLCHEYELYAINYSKTLPVAGYYNADIKCGDEIWWRFDDRSVSESSLNSVFINESSTHRSSGACLLVYRRREQPAVDTGEQHSPRSSPGSLTTTTPRSHPDPQSQVQTEAQNQVPSQDKEGTVKQVLEAVGGVTHEEAEKMIGQVLEAVDGATHEQAEKALNENNWDFTLAVQQLKIDQLYGLGLGLCTRDKCKQTLEESSWDLEKAVIHLTSQYSQGTQV